MDAIVTQLDSIGSKVIKCTAVQECMRQNLDVPPCSETKKCLLSVNHGDRCLAYPQDSNVFLIDTDINKIKQIPNK
jgi:hypothetical protein